ncbi:MAG: DUF393 domain-containing protein [Pseudomonadota bacterium]
MTDSPKTNCDQAPEESAKTKVYYNSACPVCKAGIQAQRAKLDRTDAKVDWIDVHQDNSAVDVLGADLEFVRERLHVVDTDGQVQVGADAFTTLWDITPGESWRARLGRLILLGPLFHGAYNFFARGLYRWNKSRQRW